MALSHVILLIISSIALTTNKVHSQEITTFSFDSFLAAPPLDLTYQGSAHVPPNSTSLRLTGTDGNGMPYAESVGRLLYFPALQFWDAAGRQASFTTTLTFTIYHVDDETPADGIAFFIAPAGSSIPPNSADGEFGLSDRGNVTRPPFFAVEFDTYQNAFDVLRKPHIGIDVNSPISRKDVEVDDMDYLVDQEVSARISYEAASGAVTVVLIVAETEVATLGDVVDLKTVLPERVQVGISSSTGLTNVAIHEIESWNFTSTLA